MQRFKKYPLVVGSIVITFVLAGLLTLNHMRDLAHLKDNFIELKSHDADAVVKNISEKVNYIHQLVRSMTVFPAVRRIDRYGENLSKDSRFSLQQLYRYAYLNVALSEIYIFPHSIDPDKIDPRTGKLEEPIAMFDDFIAADEQAGEDGGEPELEEVEIHEYRLVKRQLEYLAKNYPKTPIKVEDIPIISGEAVITCDNTEFTVEHFKAKIDGPREGLMFTAPFYNDQNEYAGAISAVIRTAVLARYLPKGNYALVNRGHKVELVNEASDAMTSALPLLRENKNLELIFSKRIGLPFSDSSPWELWVVASDQEFYGSVDVKSANRTFIILLIVVFLIGGALSYTFYKTTQRAMLTHTISKGLEELTQSLKSVSVELNQQAKILTESMGAQAASTTEISASVEELNATVQNNLASSESLKGQSEKNESQCEIGLTGTEKLKESMSDIDKSAKQMETVVTTSADQMQEVVSFLQNIADKTKVINEIVFQTRLLSFNASVEAARAGDAGKGFAVVAEEVGKLAQMSGQAAEEIGSIINQGMGNTTKLFETMQTEIKMALSDERKHLDDIIVSGSSVTKALSDISQGAQSMHTEVEQIERALREQSVGLKQINDAIQSYSASTNEITPLTEKVHGISQNIARQTESLQQLSRDLKKIV